MALIPLTDENDLNVAFVIVIAVYHITWAILTRFGLGEFTIHTQLHTIEKKFLGCQNKFKSIRHIVSHSQIFLVIGVLIGQSSAEDGVVL